MRQASYVQDPDIRNARQSNLRSGSRPGFRLLRIPSSDPLAPVDLPFEADDEFLDPSPELLALLGHRNPLSGRAHLGLTSSPKSLQESKKIYATGSRILQIAIGRGDLCEGIAGVGSSGSARGTCIGLVAERIGELTDYWSGPGSRGPHPPEGSRTSKTGTRNRSGDRYMLYGERGQDNRCEIRGF